MFATLLRYQETILAVAIPYSLKNKRHAEKPAEQHRQVRIEMLQ
jgi:hypothetical protein